MEHIGSIVQEVLDHAAEQIELESPKVAEQIRHQSEKIDMPRHEPTEKILRMVC